MFVGKCMFIVVWMLWKIRYFCGFCLFEGIKLIYLSDCMIILFILMFLYVKKYISFEVGWSWFKCLVWFDKSLVEKKENCVFLKIKIEDKYICIIFVINKIGVVCLGFYLVYM